MFGSRVLPRGLVAAMPQTAVNVKADFTAASRNSN
jgi:hypothetical protein